MGRGQRNLALSLFMGHAWVQVKRPMSSLQPSDEVRKYLSQIGTKGGKTVTPKKMAHLASIQSKGGQTVTAKKLAHLATIQSKGGQTVTPKKLAALAKARAARIAKATQKKQSAD